MPFGDAPAVFQGFLNNVLRDMLSHFVCMYIDEILIFSKSQKDHVQHVQAALLCPLQHSLFIKAEKCEIHVIHPSCHPSVSFLGYMISPGNIREDPTEISAVLTWPIPDSRKCWNCFLLLPSQIRGSAFHSPVSGHQRQTPPFRLWSNVLPSLRCQTLGWGQFCPWEPSLIRSSTPAPFSLYFHQPNWILTLGSANCLQ